MPAVGQQVIVEPVAQVGHAHQMLMLIQSQILRGGHESGGGGGRILQSVQVSQPGIEIIVFVQCRGAVHPGADGQKFFPVGHYLFPVALIRLPQVDLLG